MRAAHRASDRLRVLMISPYFPPRRRVGAQRAFKFARYLPELGIDPLVVHLRTHGETLTEQESSALSSVRQLALLAPLDWTLTSSAARKTVPRPAEQRADNVRSWLDARIPIDSWWPVLVAQLPQVLTMAREFAPQVVWSTADPWSSHALALRVARRLKLPWLADFRDPWSLCRVRGRERPRWVRSVDARAERRYLEAASAATFTANSTTDRYRAAYPALAERFHTIENSFDPEGYVDAVGLHQPHCAVAPVPELVLTFLGRFRQLSSAARVIELRCPYAWRCATPIGP